jgi:hypothetical protein
MRPARHVRTRIVAMTPKIAALASVLVLVWGIGNEQPNKPVEAAKPLEGAKHFPPLHRFENVSSPQSPGIALDTVTGQYCKTWEWTYKTATMNGGLDTVPTCLRIFRETPSNGQLEP